jgi:glutamate synthase domain-containing protein 3
LLAVGCLMARQCHLNTCPAGVATQREDLRAKFKGTPEMVIRFFGHIAQEVRETLAELGFRRLEDVIGRTDLLEQAKSTEGRANTLDLESILTPADPSGERPRRCLQERNQRAEQPLDEQLISDARDALDGRGAVCLLHEVHNQNRAVGTRLAGEIARRYGDGGLPAGSIQCHLRGSAGQSFGAFLARGVRLVLTGEANDYVGKGMGGGEIAIRPPVESKLRSHENVIIGNTVLYGATGGSLYAAGRAGERFAVRNSGAKAVVEGVGDHGCEYMTEGVVAILGETGRNFGAGMSNGIAYVLDEDGLFPSRLNPEMVNIARLRQEDDVEMLAALVQRHVQLTGSERGRDILDRWEHFLPLFWKVAPSAAMTEEGPKTIVHRHLESIRALAGVR